MNAVTKAMKEVMDILKKSIQTETEECMEEVLEMLAEAQPLTPVSHE